MKQIRLLTLLALLLTAATGAWADETPLVTIENKDYTSFTNGSKTFDDKVTVTFSNLVYNFGDESGWTAGGNASLLTVAGTNGYTITSCKFYTQSGTANTGYTVEGESPSVYLHNGTVYIDDSKSVIIGTYGVTKIEVYGAAPAGYTVSMKSGVKDADKWTISPNPAEEGQTVTLTYTGRLKVKGVKATSDAAAPSVPDGALSGVFSVSSTKKVNFSKGNLRYASSKWSFFDNQYDYYESYSADAWDKFGWSTSATTYGMNTSQTSSDYYGDFVDWGATMGAGWFTLSKDEWTYLLDTRTVNGGTGDGKSYTTGQSVNGKLGVVIYPDNYTGAVYSGSDWATFESAGCVFLPAAGIRSGSSVWNQGTEGYYWSASPYDTGSAYSVEFVSGGLSPANVDGRSDACSVRLVREVATSDAEAAEASLIVNPVVGQVIGADGKNYADAAAATAAGTTAVAKICYVGSDNGEAAPYNHGLALALSDANGGSTCYWNTSFTDAGHTKQTNYTFTEESGLQYNDTHNSDAYPAFQAAIANNGTAAPTGCSSWFLPSGYQWKKMIDAVGGHTNLGLTGGSYYWSSSENDADHAWDLDSDQGIWCNSNKSFEDQVRACLAF